MKKAFLFSGQGNQVVGMCADIYDKYPHTHSIYELANDVADRDIKTIIFDGPEEELNLTENTQIALLATELAIYKVLEEEGITADFYAGFSLGEWSALVAAGVIDLQDAFRLVKLRGISMQQAMPIGKYGMATVLNQSEEQVVGLCDAIEGFIAITNINAPGKITVSGDKESINQLVALGERQEIPVVELPISICSHCKYAQPARDVIEAALADIGFREPKRPIVMNISGEVTTDPVQIKANIIEQITHPVLFQKSLETMAKMGVDVFVEVGPGRTLGSFVKATCKGKDVYRTDSCGNISKLVNKIK